jgi:hypothetical protein
MKILIYTTHRTGSTSLANFLMFNFNYDYHREGYFRNEFFKKHIETSSGIIIKLTPIEVEYDLVKDMFDKRIILIREDIQSQSESRIYAEKENKFFSAYNIPESFLIDNNELIEWQKQVIIKENELLKKCDNCLHITYEELYKSNSGILKLEKYFDTKFKYGLEYKRYRNMNQNLL